MISNDKMAQNVDVDPKVAQLLQGKLSPDEAVQKVFLPGLAEYRYFKENAACQRTLMACLFPLTIVACIWVLANGLWNTSSNCDTNS